MCHNGDPNAVGGNNVVRHPDKAGQRSATGLSEDNAGICEDCHNWQYEVQRIKPVNAPQKDLEAHAAPSHPQRETLHGYSMHGVEERGEYVPGAKCEDCHMPRTDSGETRLSHGMEPMLPGHAGGERRRGRAAEAGRRRSRRRMGAGGRRGREAAGPARSTSTGEAGAEGDDRTEPPGRHSLRSRVPDLGARDRG